MKQGISVVLPAYKEEENLKSILPHLNECLNGMDYEIIIVDTQEPLDQTKEVCGQNGCKWVPRAGGNDYGDAIRTGIAAASKNYMVIMDADGSHDPEDIKRLYSAMEDGDYDLVIGSRYCKGGDTQNPFVLKAMSRILNWVYKIAFRLPVEDVSDSFRMYRTDQVKQLELKCQNFDIVEEIIILLNNYVDDFKVKEVPIVFNERVHGETKRDLFKFILSYIKTMMVLLKRQRESKKAGK